MKRKNCYNLFLINMFLNIIKFLSYPRGLSENLGHHGWPTTTTTTTTKHWLKRPKATLHKTKFGPKYKWFKISYLEFFFWKYFFGHTTFFIFVHTFQWAYNQRFFLISDFLAEVSKPTNYSFTQKTSLILPTSSHLTLKIICSCNTTKSLSHFTDFPANMFLFVIRKNICTAPTISWCPRTSF